MLRDDSTLVSNDPSEKRMSVSQERGTNSKEMIQKRLDTCAKDRLGK
jgi:hypothetical protein